MSVLSFFMAVTGGVSWWEIEKILLDISVGDGCLFVVFVSIMILILLNIITGIFVNDAIESAQLDRDVLSQAELTKERALVRDLQRFFADLDADNSGTIARKEFDMIMKVPDFSSFFTALGIDLSNFEAIFELFDVDGTGE